MGYAGWVSGDSADANASGSIPGYFWGIATRPGAGLGVAYNPRFFSFNVRCTCVRAQKQNQNHGL